MMIIIILSVVLMVVSVLGYSFVPPEGYVGTCKALMSIAVYYVVFSFSIFTTLFLTRISFPYVEFYESAILGVLTIITAYGVSVLGRIWRFSPSKLKDPLVYGSIVYLMDKCLTLPNPVVLGIDIAVFILAIWTVVLSLYVVFKFKRLKFFMDFENFELISILFMATFFLGLCALSLMKSGIPDLILTALTAYALYTIISNFVRPIID